MYHYLIKRFVETWTKDYAHFNNTSSSRIEGMHATLKRYMKASTYDIDIVVGRVANAITAQINRIQQENATAQDKSLSSINNMPFFLAIAQKISGFDLTNVLRQYALAHMNLKYPTIDRYATGECKKSFSRKMGIPCSHEIKIIVAWVND